MGKTVLIVDDSRFMRAVVRNECERNGCTVVAEADCSDGAVEKYKEFKPDIVTMDITMTVDGHTVGRSSNGIDAIKQIKEYDPEAKILVVSAMGQKCYVIEAIEAGAKDFVIKPFDEARFAEALSHFM
ncbi:two-component system, chemotaxis family, response regulator CheY [Pseudobutyrivibrio sp. 49]|uniref:response regulator n=1 Tax=unclassified Pseudobutyrivibrio TaxID=2638619 RepID=UPI000887B652|nr:MULTISPECIES: response regulator [unclassified Pseudobutyrivibrio]SDI06121.1 two-component system, chemotaxis family, response regulator CheY [Pseudobutyrivibrio sp. 49]SFO11154.1 two-component system, chemotaxis family, response regulator CheY [Pseudobutyrivibrio sp. UC1225]